MCTSDTRLSWVLAALAGMVGAAAFLHTTGYFVTFMTGNTERAVLGYFHHDQGQAVAAGMLLGSFLAGVVAASWLRRHVWSNHPHNVTVLTTLCLALATLYDLSAGGWHRDEVLLGPTLLVAFGIGALNTSFVDAKGEVRIPLSYVTGTVVKLGQAIERHVSGVGPAADWLEYLLLYASFAAGALLGGLLGMVVGGPAMLMAATVVCLATTVYTRLHEEIYGPLIP
ncbi:MAG: DUF1275 domain-containing protein [Mycobacteriaceae bacterium]|nr:DUF1275 domain-containing protein [Mycobacteriaceae bacterium]